MSKMRMVPTWHFHPDCVRTDFGCRYGVSRRRQNAEFGALLGKHLAAHKRGQVAPETEDEISEKPGAGEGIRTLDPNLGKVVLYP
jgi:hypothetical protein